jgi:hypothetical protein
VDDRSESGLVHTLALAAMKPIDDAIRHIYGMRSAWPRAAVYAPRVATRSSRHAARAN